MTSEAAPADAAHKKLHGRAFYESIGCPKFILAPMVDQSEFAWRMLARSFLSQSDNSNVLAYTPMFHARHFAEGQKYRNRHFQPTKDARAGRPDTPQPFLDGNPALDRPLFVQFCANDPAHLLAAAEFVAPYCDAVDLNLGCPQGIARKGHYGSFLQEDQELIYNLIHTLHENLSIPVTAKIRILDTKEATLKYAQNVLSAGASILTVHGRRREQKGHLTGLADWDMIRYLRDNLPPETVLFANGNVLQHGDLERCLEATGADGVMSAEGILSDPAIFANPPEPGKEGPEYWRGKDGRGGWRVDAVLRRYLDILHRYVFEQEPPARRPLFVPGGDTSWMTAAEAAMRDEGEPPSKKRKRDGRNDGPVSANLSAVQPHLFHLLHHFVRRHHDVRNMLAKCRPGNVIYLEKVLDAVEFKVAQGILEHEGTDGKSVDEEPTPELQPGEEEDKPESSAGTVRECKRPWWVVQPIVRPLPNEAIAKGAVTVKKGKSGEGPASEKVAGERAEKEAPQLEEKVASPERTADFTQSELVSG